MRYCNYRYYNFQSSFVAFIFKQCPPSAATYIIIVIYQLFEMISREGLAVDRIYFEFSERFPFKHLYLNNAPERNDLHHYRNLSIIWNDLIKSFNSYMHLETFFSIETLFSHIFFGLQLLDFWCAFNDYQILFSKYRFLKKSRIFVW